MATANPHLGDPLTEREAEVLQARADHGFCKIIGMQLGISEQTIKNHCASIFVKLGVDTGVQAIAEGFRRGILR